jgi:arylsulfatase A-like enzyme
MEQKPNVILVICDTLRADYLGCYGNKVIRTPNIDRFSKECILFTNAYSESLPTIPVRRAIFTGRRAYPFRNYKPLKWDIVYLPGWQPIDNDEDTLTENLVKEGYYTGFVTDTLHYFTPGMNFTRGFWQWEFIRGKLQDRWKSPSIVRKGDLEKYGDPEEILKEFPGNMILRHTANTLHIRSEFDFSIVQLFKWASDFVEENYKTQPFYLLIDSFFPHEPWEAPEFYWKLYSDPNYRGKTIIHTRYGPADYLTSEEIENIKAHYMGLVTFIDAWFGLFIEKLERLNLLENSIVIFTSDHGTSFADNPKRIIGKPHYSMYPSLVRIPLLIRLPKAINAGKIIDKFVYNIDITATIYDITGLLKNKDIRIDGQSLLPLMINEGEWGEREYLTSRYGDSIWYRDENLWAILDIDGNILEAFEVKNDQIFMKDISNEISRDYKNKIWTRILADAGGEIPDYRYMYPTRTDALGEKKN